MTDGDPTRRRVLQGIAAAATVGLAGCNSDSGDATSTATTERTAAATTSETTASETTTESGPSGAAPRVESFSLDAATAGQTRPVGGRVAVRNVGSEEFYGRLRVLVGGSEARQRWVTVPAGETEQFDVSFGATRVGEHDVTAAAGPADDPVDAATAGPLTVEQFPPSFVERDGTDFVIDGQPITYSALNTNLAYEYMGRSWVDRATGILADNGVRVTRTMGAPAGWADVKFHLGPGEFDDAWFDFFDYSIVAAKRAGIRLIVPLISNWGTDPPSSGAYAEWSETADGVNDFFEDERANQYYRNYVERVLTHENQLTGVEYRNDPTVMMWEVGNEMQYQGDRTGESLADWYDRSAAFIKSLDDTHLVGSGMHGASSYVYSYSRNAYVESHQSEHIDACSFHGYPLHKAADGGVNRLVEDFDEYVETHVRKGHEEVGKPVYMGEFGTVLPEDRPGDERVERRNEAFRRVSEVAKETGLDGLHFFKLDWDARGRFRDEGAPRTSGAVHPDDEETLAIVADYSAYANSQSGDAFEPR